MSAGQRQVGEHTLDNPAQYQDSAKPNPDRDDHQMQLQGHSAAVVHRTAYTFKATMTALVPLNSHAVAKIKKSIPRSRHRGARVAS